MDQGNILGPSARRTGEAGKTAPQPVWEANEVITRERGGVGGGRVTQRGTEPETPQLHIEPWLLESAETTTKWESDRGAFKNQRKSNWRGRKRCLQYGTKTKRLAKRPRTLCHRKAGTDGNTTSSWMNDWRANTLGSTRRANNLRKMRGAPR